ncbi:superoxide dismutase family protein [Corynebacterium marinum]|uniref:Superoxide dismutase [Cu-Zn] n=1 Tax=Corynebacterium marinum DSM 44953 TaxID=1224162 RepID=A0A0B6TKH9_9CORY|nr:superoxide dismutase family protein [Corynebacterium marinum]AJK68448.1 hypothetical protein B840_04145 [Corynebacterium marinum DSM 44953]GGO15188.1 superoxide dismutase [Cu-Zn] [Corynebacterium marinum]
MRSPSRSLPRTAFAVLGVTGLLAVGACATENESPDAEPVATVATMEESTTGETLSVVLNDAEGTEFGTVEISEVNDALQISADLSGLEPGFYGFHIHQTGLCEPDSAAPGAPDDTGDFLSAGGHLGSDEADHPDHAGDLPQLLVKESGDAVLTFETDRLTLSDLEDEDGSAIMIHSGPDNYANIPERYASEGADEDSLNTGDAGSRLACGVVDA